MSNANNGTSVVGSDNPLSVGFGAVGLARDALRPPNPPGDAPRGFGMLGLAGNGADTKAVADGLPLPTGILGDLVNNPDTNILHLRGRLPEAGVCGISTLARGDVVGVLGYKNTGEPNGTLGFLAGTAPTFNQTAGVYGESQAQGVVGVCNGSSGNGVLGFTQSTGDGAGVAGNSASGAGTGVHGHTSTGVGVLGTSDGNGPAGRFNGQDFGVVGFANRGAGSFGVAGNTAFGAGTGVHGHTTTGVGVLGTSDGSGFAGRFDGIVQVTGDIQLANGDCAEDFDVWSGAEPGTVMVLDGEGALRESATAYDKRVAGVISGAGGYKPGLILDRQSAEDYRVPLALLGKVYCKVDAQCGSIEVGDLLTTSPTPGHAMKASDPIKAFGAVIGKALRAFKAGQGLIPILVSLQ